MAEPLGRIPELEITDEHALKISFSPSRSPPQTRGAGSLRVSEIEDNGFCRLEGHADVYVDVAVSVTRLHARQEVMLGRRPRNPGKNWHRKESALLYSLISRKSGGGCILRVYSLCITELLYAADTVMASCLNISPT